jgi:CRP/FNR family transcriptional regulator, cyclic AMP receptor protein
MSIENCNNCTFSTEGYLASFGRGKTVTRLMRDQIVYSQGSQADAVFYLRTGRAKLTVVSRAGKEATVMLLCAGDFVGEEAIAGTDRVRKATASTLTSCELVRISKEEMSRVLAEEPKFSAIFLKFVLERSLRTQDNLVDQLFNSSERRLARMLLLMASYGTTAEPQPLIPRITQETLAEMIGTTRSRVSFFMNRFRKLGYIDYRSRIRVHKSLLNVVLHDHSPR